MNRPIVWTREYTKEQISKVSTAQSVWHEVFGHERDSGHYLPLQLCAGSNDYKFESRINYGSKLEERIGVTAYGIYTLELLVAKAVYYKAWQDTAQRYPEFDQHSFTDGMMLGERVIIWDNPQLYHLAASFLSNSIFRHLELYKEHKCEELIFESVAVQDFFTQSPSNDTTPQSFPAGREKFLLVGINSKKLDEMTVYYLENLLNRGLFPNSTNRCLSNINPNRIFHKYFRPFSDSELVILNRKDSRKPLSDLDIKLLNACKESSLGDILQCLKEGANPNCISSDEQTPLVTLINHLPFISPTESAGVEQVEIVEILLNHGAHVDLSGYLESTPIGTASAYRKRHIMELLLKRGADSSIPTSHDGLLVWAEAWDALFTGSFAPGNEEETQTQDCLKLLENHSPTPYYTPGSAFDE